MCIIYITITLYISSYITTAYSPYTIEVDFVTFKAEWKRTDVPSVTDEILNS